MTSYWRPRPLHHLLSTPQQPDWVRSQIERHLANTCSNKQHSAVQAYSLQKSFSIVVVTLTFSTSLCQFMRNFDRYSTKYFSVILSGNFFARSSVTSHRDVSNGIQAHRITLPATDINQVQHKVLHLAYLYQEILRSVVFVCLFVRSFVTVAVISRKSKPNPRWRLGYAHAPSSQIFLKGFSSDATYECICQIRSPYLYLFLS